MSKNKKLTYIDLFCGIGSFHYSFEKVGFECVMACDISKSATDTYEKNYKIKLTCNKSGEMLFRFIRVVASEKEREFITELEKQNDIEICKQWRGDYRKLLKKIENMGIYIQEDCQKDPAEDGISIEVNKQLFTWDRKEERSISKNQVRYRNI